MLNEPVAALCRHDALNGHDGRGYCWWALSNFPFDVRSCIISLANLTNHAVAHYLSSANDLDPLWHCRFCSPPQP